VFLFGYVVEYQSERYEKEDWFASRFVANATVTGDYDIFKQTIPPVVTGA
jgi:hypothetical protein